jgi:PhnB protein
MDFAETFWSPGYGSVVDRFGVPWMVNTTGK